MLLCIVISAEGQYGRYNVQLSVHCIMVVTALHATFKSSPVALKCDPMCFVAVVREPTVTSWIW